MDDKPSFDASDEAATGIASDLSPLVRRVLAGNEGPMTFKGTCTYIVGRGEVAVIDPGPDDPEHVAAILRALEGERVTHILVTHTHVDHSPAAAALKRATGARLVGCGPHRPSRPLLEGEINRLEGSGDRDYTPDVVMADGDAVTGPDWTLRAVATPGHTANHLAFDLPEENALFSGDHVMAWSTSFVGPPDGAMAPYMASLEKVRDLGHAVFWPGHGGPVRDPQRFVRALISHRRFRETMIVDRLREGDRRIEAIVDAVYPGLASGLRRAAALNVFAHLEDLVSREVVRVDGVLGLDAEFLPA